MGENETSKLLKALCADLLPDLPADEAYTNHCMRATNITYSLQAGITPREICELTGHQQESSLAHYAVTMPSRKFAADEARLECALGGTSTVLDHMPRNSLQQEDDVAITCIVEVPPEVGACDALDALATTAVAELGGTCLAAVHTLPPPIPPTAPRVPFAELHPNAVPVDALVALPGAFAAMAKAQEALAHSISNVFGR